jgi:hypothetical protein
LSFGKISFLRITRVIAAIIIRTSAASCNTVRTDRAIPRSFPRYSFNKITIRVAPVRIRNAKKERDDFLMLTPFLGEFIKEQQQCQ